MMNTPEPLLTPGEAERIKGCIDRMVRLFQRRPEVARSSSTTSVRLGPALRCEVRDGDHTYTIAMSESAGGDGSGPDPGGFGRGALGSCLAIGLGMQAAQRGLPVRAIEVELTAHYDVGGMLGTSAARPGYSLLEVRVRVDSDASRDELEALLRDVEVHSPWLDNLANPVEIRRTLVLGPAEPRSAGGEGA